MLGLLDAVVRSRSRLILRRGLSPRTKRRSVRRLQKHRQDLEFEGVRLVLGCVIDDAIEEIVDLVKGFVSPHVGHHPSFSARHARHGSGHGRSGRLRFSARFLMGDLLGHGFRGAFSKLELEFDHSVACFEFGDHAVDEAHLRNAVLRLVLTVAEALVVFAAENGEDVVGDGTG